jgi:hypothetical protein
MLDFNSRSALADRINFLIDKEIDATAAKEQRRNYLGASVIGHDCERHVQYQLLAARGEVARKQPPARNMRIFDRGNIYEERARQWLKSVGFLFGHTKKGKSFSDYQGQFKGHVDGVLTGWARQGENCPVELPALWECKCLAGKYWNKLDKERLQNYSPTYYTQVQLYMHYLELPRCLFTAVNADNMEIYHELVPYSPAEAALYRSRVQAVINAANEGYLLQRISLDRSYFLCKWCDFSGVCPCP